MVQELRADSPQGKQKENDHDQDRNRQARLHLPERRLPLQSLHLQELRLLKKGPRRRRRGLSFVCGRVEERGVTDEFDLARFLEAQRATYSDALAELRRGRKESHWMWFVFPQLGALGRSGTALFYGIGSAAEARAYLSHPVLGARLIECTEAVLAHRERMAEDIFGTVDALKCRSSMTLFEAAAQAPEPFADALAAFYGGERDEATVRLLLEDPA
jgi:uncharacterized protein (DUF1810 family)